MDALCDAAQSSDYKALESILSLKSTQTVMNQVLNMRGLKSEMTPIISCVSDEYNTNKNEEMKCF